MIEETLCECPECRNLPGDPVDVEEQVQENIVPAHVLPVLYLKGISTGDFSEALESILGKNVVGVSAQNIVRLKQVRRGTPFQMYFGIKFVKCLFLVSCVKNFIKGNNQLDFFFTRV